MSDFFRFIQEIRIPKKKEVDQVLASFSRREWFAFSIFAIVLVVSAVIILEKINSAYMVEVPSRGGSFSEGIVGTPRFVNPVLAASDADKDIAALIYSGLMKKTPGGELKPDLAENYTLSPDGLTYTFHLRDKIFFHDGEPVTAADIEFTIAKINDPLNKSPKRSFWDGVRTNIIDPQTIQFILQKPYSSFLENTTLGILPSHLWIDAPGDEFSFSDLNIHAVGSGPYEIKKVANKSSGIVDYYVLKSFTRNSNGKPHINKIKFSFYPNEKDMLKAFDSGQVDQISSITPSEAVRLAQKGVTIDTAALPRVFGLFFNSSQSPVFTDKKVVEAFSRAIDKERIIREALSGYGTVADSPIPPTQTDVSYKAADREAAAKILNNAGWKKGSDGTLEKQIAKSSLKLQFSIATADIPELRQAANSIKEDLEALGAKVELQVFEVGNLNQDIIRPRKYEALLFGQIVNSDADLFAFWHSSQKSDPGLNIALYANSRVDNLLQGAISAINPKDRAEKHASIEQEIKRDLPAIFIYSPQFTYAVSKNIHGIELNSVSEPRDRFLGIADWYIESDSVWKIFIKNN